jgi:TetR/AcrR family transcriptional regulator, mexJK operon transcriptional repressor
MVKSVEDRSRQTENIQKAALMVFNEKGYTGASMVEIASKAGVNPATIYRFFITKQDLFQSLQRPDLDFPDEQEQKMRQRIIQSALEVFSQKGYSTTTMDEIADAVGLSKPAIYFYYPSKEKLFSAVLENPVGFKMIEASMKQFLSDSHADMESGLIHLAKTYLSLFQNAESLCMLKIVLSEGIHNREIAVGFTEKIVGRGSEVVAVYLSRFCTLDVEKLHFRIQTFFGMLFSWGLVNMVFAQKPELRQAEVDFAAREIVNEFIYGIRDSIKDTHTQESV